jgi:hypothetical protein
MRDEWLEERLREAPLGEPSAAVRARLLSRARERQGARRWRAWTHWALAAAAGLLLATNLIFGRVHEQRLAALTGGPVIERQLTWADIGLYREQSSLLLLRCEQRESRWLDE